MARTNRKTNAEMEPRGELAFRTLAMPADTNPGGDMFGGWIMSLMDAAGAMTATKLASGRVVTVAVSDIIFRQPVQVGDVVCCYADVAKIGVLRQGQGDRVKVTDAYFTFVAVNEKGRPRPIARAND
jgi:acyl-CoA thioesterase YciA